MVGSLSDVPRKRYTDLDETLQNEYFQKPPFEPLEQTKFYDFWRKYYTAFSRAQNLLALTCQEKEPNGSGVRRVPSKYFKLDYSPLDSWRDIDFETDELELEQIKDVNIKNEYSFTSNILLYETCPQQYRFFKELEFSPARQSPMLFGTLVHETIEDVHKAVLRGEKSRITHDQIEQWFNSNYINLSKKERVYLAPETRQAAFEHVIRYVERQSKDWSRIKEAEVEVALVKDTYILKGKIDLIRGEGDTVEIVDFKSAEEKPDQHRDQDILERYRRQLEVYAHLVESRHNYRVSKMHIYYTSDKDGDPLVSFKKEGVMIDNTIADIDHTVQKIENKDFALAIEDRPRKLCSDCDMRYYCNAVM